MSHRHNLSLRCWKVPKGQREYRFHAFDALVRAAHLDQPGRVWSSGAAIPKVLEQSTSFYFYISKRGDFPFCAICERIFNRFRWNICDCNWWCNLFWFVFHELVMWGYDGVIHWWEHCIGILQAVGSNPVRYVPVLEIWILVYSSGSQAWPLATQLSVKTQLTHWRPWAWESSACPICMSVRTMMVRSLGLTCYLVHSSSSFMWPFSELLVNNVNCQLCFSRL